MPSAWFEYRNYATKSGAGLQPTSQASQSAVAQPSGVAEAIMPGGYVWRFTGLLAQDDWKTLLGYDGQSMAASQGNDMGSSLDDRAAVLAQTKHGRLNDGQMRKKLGRRQRVKAWASPVMEEEMYEESKQPEKPQELRLMAKMQALPTV